MKLLKKTTIAVATCMSLVLSAGSFATENFDNDVEKQSYSMGASIGNYLSSQIYSQSELGAQIEVQQVINGVIDALKNEQKMSDEEVLTYLNERSELLNLLSTQKMEKIALESKKASEAYLAKNKDKDGVTTTDSGLQYEVITMGEGVKPNAEDVVTVKYKGTLVDGTVFDETTDPVRFALLTAISGWEEGLRLMPEGSTFRFTIPSDLAYGEDGAGEIPGDTALIFEVELVKSEKPSENAKGMGLSGMGMDGMMGAH
ncbi:MULTISPECIES: FKBP-type peptidyl-prolyl cis-trans isomerase [Shewanella]|uniref:FKBP-type peptidyl-prolyl cis-trans isomerase n=1 Tax=Shewanella TaxID=22 RepID=UPI001BBDEEC7|nr:MULTISPECIES: FKBP-type peptidyl-prolyl cis-trans isomerase [Shewanella]GIU48552.1 peptidyl-prolyl cis-trans isomerase [Shewanella sp. KT0246]